MRLGFEGAYAELNRSEDDPSSSRNEIRLLEVCWGSEVLGASEVEGTASK